MINKFIYLAFFIILATSCDSHDQAAETGHDDHSDHSKMHTSTLSLSLDGESKWQMDQHTREVFAQMAGRFDTLNPTVAPTDKLAAIGNDLRKDIEKLIAGCTMTGDAHNELHKFLAVYIPAVDALQKNSELDNAKEVHGLIKQYYTYFE